MSLKTSLKAIARGGAAAAAVLLAGGVIVAAPAAAADTDGAGVDRFGACVSAQGQGRVLLLVDQSRSLQKTDPSNSRSTAATMLTRQLADYASSTGAKLEIAVAGFAEDYHESLDWTTLDEGSLGRVDDAVTSTANQQSGQDTDYWQALEGARHTFGQNRPSGPAGSCQMLAWFTDGALDFTPRDGVSKPYAPGQSLSSDADVAAMISAARNGICRDGGLADQLRTSDIVNVAIGLSGGGEKPDFGVLRSIATGEADGDTCGKVQGAGLGDFYPANDIEGLLFAFDRLSTPGQQPLEQEKGACVVTVCDEGKHRFVLDTTVSSVSILAAATETGLTPVLIAPDGTEIRMESGQAKKVDADGVSVDYDFPSDKSVSIRLANSTAPGWSGVWALVFLAPTEDGAKTRSSIHITGGLRPALADDSMTLHSGDQDTSMKLKIVDAAGKTVDAATLPGTVDLSAELVDKNGTSTPIAKNLTKQTVDDPLTVDLTSVPAGPATLRLGLSVTTAPAKEKGSTKPLTTTLEPVNVEVPVTVNPPLGYPTVSGRLSFGTVEGAGDTTATIEVTGPGCVWIDGAKTDFTARPDGADGVAVSADANSEATCLKLTDGQKTTLPVTLTVPSEVNGDVGGTLTVMAAPKDDGPAVPVEVAFSASLSKPLNTAQFTIALILALILGPLIPLLLLYLFKWLTARIPGVALRAQQIPVRIEGGTVLRDNQPFAARDNDLISLVPGLDGATRRIDLGGVVLKTRTGWSPFGAATVVGSAPGLAAAGGKEGATIGKTPDALLPLAVHNNWLLLHDPSGPAESATVVLLVTGDAGRPLIDRIVGEVRDRAPSILPQLREAARKNAGLQEPPVSSGQSNPFGGGAAAPVGNPFGGGPAGDPFGGSGGAGGFAPPNPGFTPPPAGPPRGMRPQGPPPPGPTQQGPPQQGPTQQGPTQQGPPSGNPFMP